MGDYDFVYDARGNPVQWVNSDALYGPAGEWMGTFDSYYNGFFPNGVFYLPDG